MVQEFHLSVTPISDDDNRYYVRVERVEQGVPLAEEQVIWPVEEWLAQARQVFTDPLSEFFQSSPENPYEVIPLDPLSSTSGAPSEPALVALGQTLYHALFQDTVRDSWVTAQGVAQNRQERLRLRLGLKGDLLARLPWEVLHAGNRPIAASADVMFSRYQGTLNTIAASQSRFAAQPSLPSSLHILMVLAAPTDQANLELKREALQLREELRGHRSSDAQGALPDIQLTLLEHPGREELTQVLEQAPFQVFHFAGHSSPGPSGGRLHLVNSRNGLTESLNGDDLAGLLANNGIQLAVLNSCLGAQAATSDDFDLQGERTLAEALIRRGIPGVLAMAERIPDQVALTLSRLFYRNLKFGHPLDLSLCRARQGLISAYGSNQLYWALPILYLHSDFGGRLVRPVPGWEDTGFSQEMIGEPVLPGHRKSYRDGSGAIAIDQTKALPDPLEHLGNDSFIFDPQDPQITTAITQLEEDLTGEGLGANRPVPDPLSKTDTGLVPSSTTALHPPQSDPAVSLHPQVIETPGAVLPPWKNPAALLLVGIVGAFVLLAGIWGLSRDGTGSIGSGTGGNGTVVVDNRLPSQLVDDAILALDRRDFGQVIQLLDQLLDKGDLDNAKRVVEQLQLPWEGARPEENQAIGFLQGRLNWQQFSQAQAYSLTEPSSSTGELSTNLEPRNALEYMGDARLQWWTLHQASPDDLRYRNAYALTLWAEGGQQNLVEAQRLLRRNIALAKKNDAEQKLATYANLALVYKKLADAAAVSDKSDLLQQAVSFYRLAYEANPRGYRGDNLSKDLDQFWMWTPVMIEEWQQLSEISQGSR